MNRKIETRVDIDPEQMLGNMSMYDRVELTETALDYYLEDENILQVLTHISTKLLKQELANREV